MGAIKTSVFVLCHQRGNIGKLQKENRNKRSSNLNPHFYSYCVKSVISWVQSISSDEIERKDEPECNLITCATGKIAQVIFSGKHL